MDANLMHISYESGILENPENPPPENLFQMTISPQKSKEQTIKIGIEFRNGCPASLSGVGNLNVTDPLKIFEILNQIGGQNGVGRIDIVENRFIGLKVSPVRYSKVRFQSFQALKPFF